MAEIVNLRGEAVTTPIYYDYEIHLVAEEGQEPVVIKEYGFLIANGAFYAIGRGENKAVELMAAVNFDRVNYVKSTGVHTG